MVKNFLQKLKSMLSLPSFWIAVIFLFFIIISIYISKTYYLTGDYFKSSIYSNISTGLITGFIISVLSSIKGLVIFNLEGKIAWLKQTQMMIMKFIEKWYELLKNSNTDNDIFFKLVYDAGSYANHVNERISQSTFRHLKRFKPSEYFLKHYNYNCEDKATVFTNLHETIKDFQGSPEQRDEIIRKISEIHRIMSSLNNKILDDICLFEAKISTIRKSFI